MKRKRIQHDTRTSVRNAGGYGRGYVIALLVLGASGIASMALADPLAFPVRTDYNLGAEAYPLAAADFDGDGDQDLAVPDRGGQTLTTLMNDGHGTFTVNAVYDPGYLPDQVVAGDLDADGDMDMVVAVATGTIAIFLNNGDGTFAARVDYSAYSVSFLDVTDLDGDGDLDIAAARYDACVISVLLNNGDGSFVETSAISAPGNAMAIKARDLDADGDLDLVTTYSTSNTLSVHLNDGTATFTLSALYTVGNFPIGLDVADLDADGDLDVAVATGHGHSVTVLLNNGDGTLVTSDDYAVPGVAFNVTAADIDADGNLDLLIANCDTASLSILFNDGSGVFGSRADFGTGAGPTSVTPVDLDGDSDLDLVTANNWDRTASVTVLLSNLHQATPTELLEELRRFVATLDLKAGIGKAFDAKLRHAADALAAGHPQVALHALNAFVNSVEAQRGKALTEAQADDLIARVDVIRGKL